jgi:DNA polymerase-3 subunit delta'
MTNNATEILLRAFENNRLPHGILLHGPELNALNDACAVLTTRLLDLPSPERIPTHPDFHSLRPSNKSRRIPLEEVRDTIGEIQQTPKVGLRKVVAIYEADRMDSAASDTLLKNLEEPPADTTLFLLSTKPAKLGSAIRSRCHHFRVLPETPPPADPAWESWLDELDDWVCDVASPQKTDKSRAAALLFTLYGLASRFESLLNATAGAEWAALKPTLPGEMETEQKLALESGIQKNIRSRRFADMSGRLCLLYSRAPGAAATRALYTSIRELERGAGLLEVYLSTPAAIEYILLRWLRAWSQR